MVTKSELTPVITDEECVEELLTRGVSEVIGREHLKKRLLSGDRLRIKLGIDPTSPDLHVGRAVPLLKLRDFQALGHQIVLIVGDFTAVIGDTSDKDAERPMLDRTVIEHNKQSYFEQAGKLLDLSRVELHYNSEWLERLTYREIGEHADLFSVADFIARDNIQRRLDVGKRVSLREVLYPLMQGYDSVAIHADVELGGTDQRFNLLAGRTLQEKFRQEPQDIIMNPLIEGIDGRKMSSSWGNTIALTAAPNDMYGKVMSMGDEQIGSYFEICTRVPLREVSEVRAGLADGTLHPKEAKMRLARELVALYHGVTSAKSAEESFVSTFSEGVAPSDAPVILVQYATEIPDELVRAGIVPSKTELRRLVDAGAVRIVGGAIVSALDAISEFPAVLRIGKHRFVRIERKS